MLIGLNAHADDPYSKLLDACMHEDTKLYVCDQMADVKVHTETAVQNQLIAWGLLNTSIILGSLIKSAVDQKVEISDNTHRMWVLGNERKVVLKRDEISIVFVWALP